MHEKPGTFPSTGSLPTGGEVSQFEELGLITLIMPHDPTEEFIVVITFQFLGDLFFFFKFMSFFKML